MVKKFSKASAAAGTADSNLLGTVKESSSQIWLAGLGAFAKAQEEGSKVFEALVKEGAGLQKKFRQFADAQVSDVTNEVSGKITAIYVDFNDRVKKNQILAQVDRAADVAVEAAVEQASRVGQRGALGERQLDDALVALAGAHDAAARPHRRAPLPLLDDRRIGGADHRAHRGEGRATPVGEPRDAGVDQGGGIVGRCGGLHRGLQREAPA